MLPHWADGELLLSPLTPLTSRLRGAILIHLASLRWQHTLVNAVSRLRVLRHLTATASLTLGLHALKPFFFFIIDGAIAAIFTLPPSLTIAEAFFTFIALGFFTTHPPVQSVPNYQSPSWLSDTDCPTD